MICPPLPPNPTHTHSRQYRLSLPAINEPHGNCSKQVNHVTCVITPRSSIWSGEMNSGDERRPIGWGRWDAIDWQLHRLAHDEGWSQPLQVVVATAVKNTLPQQWQFFVVCHLSNGFSIKTCWDSAVELISLSLSFIASVKSSLCIFLLSTFYTII